VSQHRERWRKARLTAVLATAVLMLLAPAAARAVILPAVTIDGPSPEIAGFGGVAMAEDGTGGLVYLKKVAGIAHVFVSRYLEGHWQAPIRVDTANQFAASWPRIGAADDGELLVVWATPFATEHENNEIERPVDELEGAMLAPGAAAFGEAAIVDPDIGDADGTSPSLAMNSTGQADIVYRVVEHGSANAVPALHSGDVTEQVRVAHFGGFRWTQLGSINRNAGVSMRPPTTANAPQIAIGPTSNGVVVWQEPEINGIARIWARRIFGSSLGYVMPVSATSIAKQPVVSEADAPSVAVSLTGQAVVAYRQAYAHGSPLPGPRILINDLPDGESEKGLEFTGAVVADAAVAGGTAAKIGPPSVDIDEHREVRLLYDSDGSPSVVEGTDKSVLKTVPLGPAFSGSEAPSASVMNPDGGGISAWPSTTPAGVPAVAVREDFPDESVQTALVAGGAGGPIDELAVGRSGLGDGLIAFQQGITGNAAIVAAQATAPPAELLLTSPKGWIKPSQALVSWPTPQSANGPLTYHVVLDGHLLEVPPGADSLRIDRRRLSDGTHEVQLLATDIDGQSTLSSPSELQIDGTPPNVRVSLSGGGSVAVVHVSALAGVDSHAIRVSFGDGHSAHGRSVYRHRYAHAGVYQIVLRVRDKIGNAGVVRKLVKAR
jgi:hypothetical protein